MCKFGCSAHDQLGHYIKCEPLWTFVLAGSPGLAGYDINCRLCTTQTRTETCQRLATAFYVYHQVKFQPWKKLSEGLGKAAEHAITAPESITFQQFGLGLFLTQSNP